MAGLQQMLRFLEPHARTHTYAHTHKGTHQEHTNTDLTNDRVARRGELIVGSAPADMPVGRGC